MFTIDETHRQILLQWAYENKSRFTSNGFGRQYGILQQLNGPPCWHEVKASVVRQFLLSPMWKEEPCFQDYIGYITEGGAIHPHTDPNQPGYQHVRFNCLLSKPESGGDRIYGDRIIPLPQEGGVWRCDAGRVTHASTPVIGITARIVLSLGFLLPI